MLPLPSLPTSRALSLSHGSVNTIMVSKILILMDLSGILRDIQFNKKPKPKDYGSTFEETRPDHFIFSVVTSTKLPLCCVNLK